RTPRHLAVHIGRCFGEVRGSGVGLSVRIVIRLVGWAEKRVPYRVGDAGVVGIRRGRILVSAELERVELGAWNRGHRPVLSAVSRGARDNGVVVVGDVERER